jgi:hypothetical protein
MKKLFVVVSYQKYDVDAINVIKKIFDKLSLAEEYVKKLKLSDSLTGLDHYSYDIEEHILEES